MMPSSAKKTQKSKSSGSGSGSGSGSSGSGSGSGPYATLGSDNEMSYSSIIGGTPPVDFIYDREDLMAMEQEELRVELRTVPDEVNAISTIRMIFIVTAFIAMSVIANVCAKFMYNAFGTR
jgi:hypothetical protein